MATVLGWRRPWFRIWDGRAQTNMRSAEVARALFFSPDDFYNPELFCSDFGVLNPINMPGWVAGLLDYLDTYAAVLPLDYVTPRAHTATSPWAHDGSDTTAPAPSADAFLEHERSRLRAGYVNLANTSRAPRTTQGLINPILKQLWWYGSRGRQLPPTQDDATDYLTFVALDRDNKGAVAAARAGLLHLCRLNRWEDTLFRTGPPLVPLEAMRRHHRRVVKKSAGLSEDMAAAFLEHYARRRHARQPQYEWRFALGTGVVIAYKVLARYADLVQLRWDEDYCWVYPLFVRFLLESRKNEQYESGYLDIARPLDRHGAAPSTASSRWASSAVAPASSCPAYPRAA